MNLPKARSLLEGLLETHLCRRNYWLVPMGPPDENWEPCNCSTCHTVTKVLKQLKDGGQNGQETSQV